MSKKKQKMYFHGECVIAEIKELPENLKRKNEKDIYVLKVLSALSKVFI